MAYKDIQFQVDKHNYQFQEQVEMLEINDFTTLFSQANLQFGRFVW